MDIIRGKDTKPFYSLREAAMMLSRGQEDHPRHTWVKAI